MNFGIRRSFFKKKEHRKEIKDLSGTRYGHLLVVQQVYFELQSGIMSYELLCDCGNRCNAPSSSFSGRNGKRHCGRTCNLLKDKNLSYRMQNTKPDRKCSCGRTAIFGREHCSKCLYIDSNLPKDKSVGYHRPVRILFVSGK
jgi:hypothetical protein